MSTKQERVMVGVFEDAGDARRAIEDLRNARFSDRAIGILTHHKHGDPEVTKIRDLEGSKVGVGAAVGAAAGAGGGALWALGVAAGFLPVVGPILAGGLLVALAASAATGAAAGIVLGALAGLGVSDDDAAAYDAEFRKGHTILVVCPGDRADLVSTILTAHQVQERRFFAPATRAQQLDNYS